MRKRIVLLGSTGSIGAQAAEVIASFPDEFELLALSAKKSVAELAAQAAALRPRYAGIFDETMAPALRVQLPEGCILEAGRDVNSALAKLPEADIVLIAISGMEGLPPLLAALEKGKTVALANKESIVCGHPLVQETLRRFGGRILPVDSEHSAIFQCLQNGELHEVERLILTASGGPFRQFTPAQLEQVTPEQALRHPTWNMGRKITIDCATMFNKGLEVIEASFLFGFAENQISVLIHPQSIVHSMVEYQDGAVIAQLSRPDMRLAVEYALRYPGRGPRRIPRLSLAEIGALTFEDGDNRPAIRLARQALHGAQTLPVTYNAANEEAVDLFLARGIGFIDIQRAVEHALSHAPAGKLDTLEDIYEADATARRAVRQHFPGREAL